MDKLILQDVRCFHGRHEIPLAPLTILVGENSTGKSTVLSAARLAWDIGNGVASLDFNEEPFDWGAYDQIACTRGGRAKTFALGYEVVRRDAAVFGANCLVRKEAVFEERDAQPRMAQWRIGVGPYSIVVDRTDDKTVLTTISNGERSCKQHQKWLPTRSAAYFDLVCAAVHDRDDMVPKEHADKLLAQIVYPFGTERPHAFAPIRTRPRRTYDRRIDMPGPEGAHVPMVLAKLRSSRSMEWDELTRELSRFGTESGLFKSVNVKPLGKEGDPFQVQITISGPPSNLVDVGYGVSQVLPVLVDCLSEEGPGQMFLMQQPEVHLHPKAQAQIGSLLGYLAVKQKKQFLVETHSDHLVDRIRMDVRDGKHGLRPKDVCILYFGRKGAKVAVHPMQLDECGNLVGVPSGYRRFFLEEEKRLIGG